MRHELLHVCQVLLGDERMPSGRCVLYRLLRPSDSADFVYLDRTRRIFIATAWVPHSCGAIFYATIDHGNGQFLRLRASGPRLHVQRGLRK